MKYTLRLVFLACMISSALADSGQAFKVLIRQEKSNRTHYVERELIDLESNSAFDGKYFKIVTGKEKKPIGFDHPDKDLVTKAATVYHHLSEARNFWVEQMKSGKALAIPKIIVRLQIKNQFDELGHFANDNRNPQFNNALSIPEGETPDWVPAERQDKWGKEIWFRPKKIISTTELGSMGPNPLTVSLIALEKPLIDYTMGQINRRVVEQIFYPSYATRPLHEDLIRYAGTYALMKLIIQGSKYADPLFVEKYYYLDSAMVPEITYHEYAHLVLSDHLAMSHSTPVNEGMADYFAAVQSGHRKVYAKVRGHSNAAAKDTQEKQKYSHWNESNRLATSDFTLSVLWDVRETLGEEVADKVIYQSRKYLKTESSTISEGLLRAILIACDDMCENPRRDKLKLYDTFSWKGF
jgi:hypothetical protein